MHVAYDLHIHSALSPCGSDDMTPNNIVNMALIKDLEVIAVTDHNCADNVLALERLAADAGLIFVPGIEMTTAEEVHVLAYFPSAAYAYDFGRLIYDALPDIRNDPSFFGPQRVLNELDQEIASREKLLLSALPYDFATCCALARGHGGVVVPAHVNKQVNSVLANLGFFPEDCPFGTIEVRPECPQESIPAHFRWIFSSDAHDLAWISEPDWKLEISGRDVCSVLRVLAGDSAD